MKNGYLISIKMFYTQKEFLKNMAAQKVSLMSKFGVFRKWLSREVD